MHVKEAYKKIDDLETKLLNNLNNVSSLSQNFQAHADYAVGFLKATGKEVDYKLVERAVRESPMMKKIRLQLDEVEYSYNNLVSEITTVRRDAIAKDYITTKGADDVHSLKEILIKYNIDPTENMFSKATYIIAETRSKDIEKKYGLNLIRKKHIVLPNKLNISEFIFLVRKYANSTYKRGIK